MTAAERQRLYRRRKKALTRQHEVTMVAGAGCIALHQVQRARPIALDIAGSAIKLGEELKREFPSMRKLLRLAKALTADSGRMQTALSDYQAQQELAEAKKQPPVSRSGRSAAAQRHADPIPSSIPPLPPGPKHIADAIHMDHIVCLEDGQKVQDLAAYLDTLGMTPHEYRKKWNLPEEYPMQAPDLILEEGATYAYDPDSGKFRRVRLLGAAFSPQRN